MRLSSTTALATVEPNVLEPYRRSAITAARRTVGKKQVVASNGRALGGFCSTPLLRHFHPPARDGRVMRPCLESVLVALDHPDYAFRSRDRNGSCATE